MSNVNQVCGQRTRAKTVCDEPTTSSTAVTVNWTRGDESLSNRAGWFPQHLIQRRTQAGAQRRRDQVDPLILPQAGYQGWPERAGFIEAPLIGPAQSADSATLKPMAMAAGAPTARVSVATEMMTNISTAVSRTSRPKA